MRMTAVVVAFVVMSTSATRAQSDCASPFAIEREAARRLLETPPARDLPKCLESPLVRVRFEAALACTSRGGPLDALVSAFAAEDDPRVLSALARALAEAGEGSPPLAAKLGDLDTRRSRELRHARVVAALNRIVARGTDAAGDFKGFFRGQFAEVREIAGVVHPLTAIATADWRAAPVRQAAIRALGSVGGDDARAALTGVRRQLLVALDVRDPEKEGWRVPIADVERYVESRGLLSVDYARAECGDEGGLRWRITHHGTQRRRFTAALVYVAESERPLYRTAIAAETFEIAYLHGRLDETEKATEFYTIVVTEHGDTATAATAHYNLACLASRAGDVDGALGHLGRALESGYADVEWMGRDADLQAARSDPRFDELLRGRDGERDD